MPPSDFHAEVKNTRPDQVCCVNGKLGWDACPREWLCPGVPPVVRQAYLKMHGNPAGLPDMAEVRSGENGWVITFTPEQQGRLGFLRHLWNVAKSWGGYDPGIKP